MAFHLVRPFRHQSCFQFVRTISKVNNNKIGVIGVPFGKGQKDEGDRLKGLELAPDAIRSTKLLEELRQSGIDVKDYGNVSYSPLEQTDVIPSMNNYCHVIPNIEKVSVAVTNILKDGRKVLTLGGDHSLAAGTIHGHLQAAGEDNLAVVYVDAHADINLSRTTPSGNIHGMCVAMAANELRKEWTQFSELDWLKYRLPLNSIGFIGLRSVDPPEVKILRDCNVTAYYMSDIVRHGVSNVVSQVLQKIDPENKKQILISIDTDSLDPLEAPSTTVRVSGGLLLRELIYIAEELHSTGRVQGVDWVELNPLLGSEEDKKKTLIAAKKSLLACFGAGAGSIPI